MKRDREWKRKWEWGTSNWRQATGDIRCRSEKSAWRQNEVKVSLTTGKTEEEVGGEGAGSGQGRGTVAGVGVLNYSATTKATTAVSSEE